MSRQITSNINLTENDLEEFKIPEELIKEYQALNEKIDNAINKIKKRKKIPTAKI